MDILSYPTRLAIYLADSGAGAISPDAPEVKDALESVKQRVDQLLSPKGKRSSRLSQGTWTDHVGICGNGKKQTGLKKAIGDIQDLRDDFLKNVLVSGSNETLNAELERAGRTRDFLDFGELLCRDALERNESCGGHFREEYQTADGEATRDDENFAHAAVWEYKGEGKAPKRHTEELSFDNVELAVRSYK